MMIALVDTRMASRAHATDFIYEFSSVNTSGGGFEYEGVGARFLKEIAKSYAEHEQQQGSDSHRLTPDHSTVYRNRSVASLNVLAISSQAYPVPGAHAPPGFGVSILQLTQPFGSVVPGGLGLIQLLLKLNFGVSFRTPSLGFGLIDAGVPFIQLCLHSI